MIGCRELSSPGAKLSSEDAEKLGIPLAGDAITLYRSGVSRCNYLSVDRPDIPFESKELCKAMAKPTELDMLALKHLSRKLKRRPRLVKRLSGSASRAWELQVYVDSDGAGCRRTRKSTNRGLYALEWVLS